MKGHQDNEVKRRCQGTVGGEVTGREKREALGCKEHCEICGHMETDGRGQVYSVGGRLCNPPKEEAGGSNRGMDCYGCGRWERAPLK